MTTAEAELAFTGPGEVAGLVRVKEVKPRELGPKPSCCRSSLKADANHTRRF